MNFLKGEPLEVFGQGVGWYLNFRKQGRMALHETRRGVLFFSSKKWAEGSVEKKLTGGNKWGGGAQGGCEIGPCMEEKWRKFMVLGCQEVCGHQHSLMGAPRHLLCGGSVTSSLAPSGLVKIVISTTFLMWVSFPWSCMEGDYTTGSHEMQIYSSFAPWSSWIHKLCEKVSESTGHEIGVGYLTTFVFESQKDTR